MDTGHVDQQLELFPVGGGRTVRSSGEGGRLSLYLRYDQLILVGVAAVIGITVVFAFGVERGKQLARAEQSVLVSSAAVHAQRPEAETASIRHVSSSASANDASVPAASAKPQQPAESLGAPAPAAPDTTVTRKRSKLAAKPAADKSVPADRGADREGKSRYVVQLVTYSRPELAQQELSRLKAKGERAFLILRNQRTIVYVGPFPSQGRATERLAALKPRYQDCFLKTL